MEGQTEGRIEGWTDGRMEGQTEGRMDVWKFTKKEMVHRFVPNGFFYCSALNVLVFRFVLASLKEGVSVGPSVSR